MSTLRDKILLLAGCGASVYEIAEIMEVDEAYIRACISIEKRRIRNRDKKMAAAS